MFDTLIMSRLYEDGRTEGIKVFIQFQDNHIMMIKYFSFPTIVSDWRHGLLGCTWVATTLRVPQSMGMEVFTVITVITMLITTYQASNTIVVTITVSLS